MQTQNNSTERMRCGAIIIKNGKILLMKRIKPNITYWVFPGGGLENGETIDDGIKREVYEETGLNAISYEKCFNFQDFKEGKNELYFLVKLEDGEPKIKGVEKERQSPDNRYELIWEDLVILDNPSLFPTLTRVWLKEYLQKCAGD